MVYDGLSSGELGAFKGIMTSTINETKANENKIILNKLKNDLNNLFQVWLIQ